MKLAQLQGAPWHTEQLHKTCSDGSKYCIHNHNICSCIANKKYFHKKCVGKGNCEWFEPKTGTPKIYSSQTYKYSLSASEIDKKSKQKEKNIMPQTDNQPKESKEEKFLRLSKGRIDKVEEAIDNLENLSDKYSYSYTEEQVDKMFDYLENRLQIAKDRFKNKKSSGGFKW